MSYPPLDELRLLHTRICKALGDPKRIQILYALHAASQNVSTLAEELDMPQPTVSRHLAILRERSLVSTERDGVQVVYSLARPEIVEILDQMRRLLRDTLEQQSEIMT